MRLMMIGLLKYAENTMVFLRDMIDIKDHLVYRMFVIHVIGMLFLRDMLYIKDHPVYRMNEVNLTRVIIY